jgi:hypothetical protein
MKSHSILVLVIIAFLASADADAKYSGGMGEPNDPYQIASAQDLLALAADTNDYNKCFILTADIDLDPNLPGGQVFTTAIIAADTNSSSIDFQGTAFTGTFDGNSHKITNFTINGNDYLGLFGYISSGGAVKNLGLENCAVSGYYYVGGLVGWNNGGSISHCYSTGAVSGSSGSYLALSYYVGTLVGCNFGGSISDCYSTGSVSGAYMYVGGLVGGNYGTIDNCYSKGDVAGGDYSYYLGGLVGWNYGSISNCYSTGAVTGGGYSSYLGGLVGCSYGSISNCYSTGTVSGYDSVGGLVGVNPGSISDCYSTGTVSGYSDVGGLVGYNYGYGDISDCYSTGAVSSDSDSSYVGGLVGWSYDGSISNCYSTGAVSSGSGSSYVGGLVGWNYGGSIINCYSTGTVSGTYYVGGLVGYSDSGSSISDCYSTGAVSGGSYVGGLMGRNDGSISNCYSTGAVSGTFVVGGLVGINILGSVSSSFWDANTSGQSTSAGGTPKTTAEMKTKSTFTSAGWDFVGETANGTQDIWRMCADGVQYPLLSWQFIEDFVCPDGVDIADLGFFVERWLISPCNQGNNFCNCTDINSDERVNFLDFAIFAAHWLEGM